MRPVEVKSAARILDLLELLSIAPKPLRQTDIVRQLSLPKSSAFALLNTLTGRGYVELRGDGYVISERYRQGDWMSGEYGLMRRAAQPVMGALAAQTGESCFLAIPAHDWQVQFVDKAVSDHALRYDFELPALRPAHSTTVGLIMLAAQPEDVLRRHLASDRITKVTVKTITDPVILLQIIERARAAGYVLSSDNSELGASGVAAPIRGVFGSTIAALCVVAPTPRFQPERDTITQRLRDAAAQISAQMHDCSATTHPGTSAPLGFAQWTC